MKEELVLVNNENGYPVAMLKYITIHFNHYKTFQEAKEKWNERKMRINYDNLYIIMGDYGITYGQIKELNNVKCKRLVMFTAKYYSEFQYTYQLKRYKDNNYVGFYAIRDIDDFREFEKSFDYVAWLNGQSKYKNILKL